jgi:hypothetical protein
MFGAVITTIQEPTDAVVKLVQRLAEQEALLIVAGDKRGPARFLNPDFAEGCQIDFLSLADQEASEFQLGRKLPVGHYSRKNVAYLHAIAASVNVLYETDDDNAPLDCWQVRSEHVSEIRCVGASRSRWVNAYRYFTDELIWPRGFPLPEIHSQPPEVTMAASVRSPIQQGLSNGSPDVDAVWRLVLDRKFEFSNARSVVLEAGNWCPFNTQSTWWWPIAYPLLYLPSYCPFRMCDIWKSFIAQRCLWELNYGVAFHAPEVFQDRNQHDTLRDFADEVPGYTRNREIGDILSGAQLSARETEISNNLRACYLALVKAGIFPSAELELLEAWLQDFGVAATNAKRASNTSAILSRIEKAC